MTALLIVVAAICLLFIGYVFYGSWLAKQWGIDPTKKTPAKENTTDSGFHLRMGSRIPVVYHRWYFLWRSAGLRIFIRIYQT